MTSYLMVSGDFVQTGGMDMANFALASYLADQGKEVNLVTHRAAPELSSRSNVAVLRVAKPAGAYSLGAPLLSRQGRASASRIAMNGGRIIVNGGNCVWGDINWVHYVHASYESNAGASIPRRVKNSLFHRYAITGERAALARARVVICNSQRTRREVVERLGVSETRAHVVYYGTDPERFAAINQAERLVARKALGWSNDRPVVLFVGALGDRRKGFDTLFSAWQSLCHDRSWDCDLAIAGAGAELSCWQQRTRQSGLTGRIRFLGFRNDVPRVMAACDAMVHPARYEAYGLGVHEALCRGLPAIVTADAGVAERYSSELQSLLLTSPDDSLELEQRLRQWRRNMDHIRALISPLAEVLRLHTWDEMSAQILRVIESS